MSNLSNTQRLVEVADGVVAAINGDGSLGLANSVAVIDGDAAFVVDATLLPRMANDLCVEIGRRGARGARAQHAPSRGPRGRQRRVRGRARGRPPGDIGDRGTHGRPRRASWAG